MQRFKNKTLVIKLSSLAVTHENGRFCQQQLDRILDDVVMLRRAGISPVIVSSGAINAGRARLTSDHESDDVARLQAYAAIGQVRLMQRFQTFFSKQGLETAQLLLTHEDLRNKQRSLNVKNTLDELIAEQVIPIINENDSVSFAEISFGDNDQLSAMICELVSAPLLVMLTQSNGLYDRDPEHPEAKRFTEVAYDNDLEQIKTLTRTITGKGGMRTKLAAVRKLTPLGIDVLISTYDTERPLLAAFEGEKGTWFHSNPNPQALKKRSWILTRARQHASIGIDKGAYEALLNNASLLPVGVRSVKGPFMRGDSVPIKYGNKVIAYGIVEYASKEAEAIKQLRSSDLSRVLKHGHSSVLIHKDNLILKTG